jgi:hypothetical protein
LFIDRVLVSDELRNMAVAGDGGAGGAAAGETEDASEDNVAELSTPATP